MRLARYSLFDNRAFARHSAFVTIYYFHNRTQVIHCFNQRKHFTDLPYG